jgi:hypothetical protein
MAEKKKGLADLRKELKTLIVNTQVRPGSMCRADVEQAILVYSKAMEVKNSLPPAEKTKVGRKAAREVESETSGEVAVPKKVAPVEREHEPRPKPAKISKADPPKVADDTPKPKRVMTEEHKAKMKAAREAKKNGTAVSASTSTPEKEEKEKPKPKVAKPKKEETPPDAPPKKEEEEAPAPAPGPREKKIPVFKMGGT